MRRSTLLKTSVAALLLGGIATPALAQDIGSTPTPPTPTNDLATEMNRDTLTIGAGGAYLPAYEGSNRYRFVPVPAAIGSFKGFNFTLLGNRLSIDVIPSRPGPTFNLEAGPIAVVDFNRGNNSQYVDPRVRALGKVDTAFEVGGYGGFSKTGVITSPYDKLSASVSYRYDVSKVHNSGILQPTINYLTPLSRKAAVGIFASAEHAERGYATTYYGVSPAQSAASGLPIYYAQPGWKDVSAGGLATYSITGDLLHGFKIVAGGTYTRLMNGFADSPVVAIAGNRTQWVGALGVAYTF